MNNFRYQGRKTQRQMIEETKNVVKEPVLLLVLIPNSSSNEQLLYRNKHIDFQFLPISKFLSIQSLVARGEGQTKLRTVKKAIIGKRKYRHRRRDRADALERRFEAQKVSCATKVYGEVPPSMPPWLGALLLEKLCRKECTPWNFREASSVVTSHRHSKFGCIYI